MAERMKEKTVSHYLMANFTGLLIVYAAGMIYYYIICNYVINTPIALGPLFLYCFVLAVPGDICLCILSAVLVKRIKPRLDRQLLRQVQTETVRMARKIIDREEHGT